MHPRSRPAILALAILGTATLLGGWSAPGHRVITRAAILALPADVPSWVRDAGAAELTAYQSNEPDRWRSTRIDALNHENSGDHYIDLEDLGDYGLTLRTLPRLRYEYVEALVRGASKPAGEQPGRGIDRFDTGRIGMLPYAIMEHYAKLVSSLNTARIIERVGGPERGYQLEAARANAVYHMGQLSHFVGDAGQPLHTTIHHHGWVGDNPGGYTTERSFHAYIDGDIVSHHRLNDAAISGEVRAIQIPADGVWDAALGLIERSHAQVEPLYRLRASGELEREPGRALIRERMADAASVLAGIYARAWADSDPTDQQIRDFLRYDDFAAETRWAQPAAPKPAAPKK